MCLSAIVAVFSNFQQHRPIYPAFYPIRNCRRAFWTRWRASSRLLRGVSGASGRAKYRPTGRGGSGLFSFWLPSGSGRWSADPVSCPRSAVRAGRWSTCPCIGAPVHACGLVPVHGFPVPGVLCRSSGSPTLPRIPCVYFLNMEYLEGQKVIFWTFPVLVEYAVREKGGAELFGRIVTACNRAERSTCGAASFVL